MKRRSRTWKVNKYQNIEARRTGFWFLPDFGSTAHMIQGATLEAAFADLQETSSNVSPSSQIAGYVCLSRIKKIISIWILQAFSPLLFTQGPPKGPERLIRYLQKRLSAKDDEEKDEISQACFAEWEKDKDEKETKASEGKNPLDTKHRCTSCYLRGREEYKLPPKDFGITCRSEYYGKYVAQGAWTRCLQCQTESGCVFVDRQPTRFGARQQETCRQNGTRLAQEQGAAETGLGQEKRTEAQLVCWTCFDKA